VIDTLVALAAESRAFYARRGPRRGPSSDAELRSAREQMPAPVPAVPAARTEVAHALGREVTVRVHEPRTGPAVGAHLEVHGGGFVLGSAAHDDVRCRALAEAAGLVVVGVEHRLAPEHPWPAAPDDVETAARWLAEVAADRFGTDRLTVGGFSSGATLALGTLLRLRDAGVEVFRGAALQFGTYDLSGTTPAGRRIADEFFLRAYLDGVGDRTSPGVSPVFADLVGLPPVLVVVGTEDVLLEDNLALVDRMTAAGGPVEVRVFPASPHGFTGHATSMATVARAGIADWLRRRVSQERSSS
jgi:acetyl esterase/lipase